MYAVTASVGRLCILHLSVILQDLGLVLHECTMPGMIPVVPGRGLLLSGTMY